MQDAVKSLSALAEEWITAGAVPEVDWARMRSLDFQEVLRARNELARGLDKYGCMLCSDFGHHVSLI